MALTPNCPSCGAAANNFIFLRNGVPVDTSNGTVNLDPFACSDLASCSISDLGNIPALPTDAGSYQLNYDQATNTFAWVASTALPSIDEQVYGSFILDPNEINSFGQFGVGDETANADMGNVGSTTFPQMSGGWIYSTDMTFERLMIDYRETTGVANPWGFVLAHGTPPLDGGVIPMTYIIEDLPGTSRLNGDTTVRRFDFTPAAPVIIPAGDVIVFGVAADAATPQGDNDRIDVPRGFMRLTPS